MSTELEYSTPLLHQLVNHVLESGYEEWSLVEVAPPSFAPPSRSSVVSCTPRSGWAQSTPVQSETLALDVCDNRAWRCEGVDRSGRLTLLRRGFVSCLLYLSMSSHRPHHIAVNIRREGLQLN